MLPLPQASPNPNALTQILAQLVTQLLVGQQQLPIPAGEAPGLSDSKAADGTTSLTVAADQVKIRGAGRRPASLVGRAVTVTVFATVDAEHENGTVTVSLAAAAPTHKRRRATNKSTARAAQQGRGSSRGKRAGRKSGSRRRQTAVAKVND